MLLLWHIDDSTSNAPPKVDLVVVADTGKKHAIFLFASLPLHASAVPDAQSGGAPLLSDLQNTGALEGIEEP